MLGPVQTRGKVRIVMVCAANVCRSPMAVSVVQRVAQATGRHRLIELDSAGVGVARPGMKPDARAVMALQRRGYAPPKSRSRALTAEDFDRADLLLAMDGATLAAMQALVASNLHPKARLFLDFARGLAEREVPDPYFGEASGFDRVVDLCEAAAHGLIDALWQPVVGGEWPVPSTPLAER
jgi:protein-tyrosine phosphatase